MKRIIASRLVAGLLFVAMPAVRAQDRLDFHVLGSIAPSCALVSDRVRIELGAVAAGELAGTGATSPWRGATFTGRDCVGATRAVVTMRAAPYPGHPGLIAPVGEAAGVAIEMRSAGGQPLPPNGSTAVEFSWASGPPELGFQARYVRVGPLQPGTAGATAQVQIRWE